MHCPDTNQRNNKVLAATTVADIPYVYWKYAQVFDKVTANELSNSALQDHVIVLAGTKTLPFGLLYNLSTNKLKAHWDYISNNLAKSFVQQSAWQARALILFVKKKESTLCLFVDYKGLNCLITKN